MAVEVGTFDGGGVAVSEGSGMTDEVADVGGVGELGAVGVAVGVETMSSIGVIGDGVLVNWLPPVSQPARIRTKSS